ncbi:MAG TPA: AAA family ATPase [Candidatus Bilamarchaeaceae archaeon]|nr:AAA family ATPase [Candidatus Bilamarchaeaceae archaeon]
MLILISGLPGTGKSRISRGLAPRLNAVHISSDSIRKKLLERRTYSEEEKALVYSEMLSQASKSLSGGKNVVADATFYKKSLRKEMRKGRRGRNRLLPG